MSNVRPDTKFKDLLIAGAGDDQIMGDVDAFPMLMLSHARNDPAYGWTVSDDGLILPTIFGTGEPADSAADVIYAGAGSDRVWAGAGDDVMYGEDGNDKLYGNDGNDIAMGGAGDDELRGDGVAYWDDNPVNTEGNDYLDGGDGNDKIWGNGGDDALFVWFSETRSGERSIYEKGGMT